MPLFYMVPTPDHPSLRRPSDSRQRPKGDCANLTFSARLILSPPLLLAHTIISAFLMSLILSFLLITFLFLTDSIICLFLPILILTSLCTFTYNYIIYYKYIHMIPWNLSSQEQESLSAGLTDISKALDKDLAQGRHCINIH